MNFSKLVMVSFLVLSGSIAWGYSGEWNRYLPGELALSGYNLQFEDGKFKLYKDRSARAKPVDDGFVSAKVEGLTYGASVQTCSKNKTKQCIGVVDYANGTKNQYSLTQIGKGSDITKSVCSIAYDKKSSSGATQSLKSCMTFSKASCQRWNDYRRSDYFKKFNDSAVMQAKQCNDFLERLNAVNVALRQNFATDENVLEEVQKNFDRLTTNESKLFGPNADAKALETPAIGIIKDFADIQDASSNCDSADAKNVFLSTTEYANMKKNELKRIMESGASRSSTSGAGSQSVKGRN